MEGKRLLFILFLIGIFILGVFQVDRLLRRDAEGSLKGESATIRGTAETTLPSGKIIVVRRDDGGEILLSLSEAYTITDELGEDLFYTDVKPGMTVTAAGIRGVEDNVVIPSLVTVNLAYAANGVLVSRFPAFEDNYFSLRYDETLWEPKESRVLSYKPIAGCVLSVKTRPEVPSGWQSGTSQRKIGGNVFVDTRYSSSDEQKLRVLTLEDPGERYGLPREVGGSLEFVVTYDPPVPPAALLECTRAVDKVVSTFLLRTASENILLVEPRAPAKIKAGEKLAIRGAARVFEDVLHFAIVDESDRRIVSRLVAVERPRGATFGVFQDEIVIPRSSENRFALRLFQFEPSTGAMADVVQLPLAIE